MWGGGAVYRAYCGALIECVCVGGGVLSIGLTGGHL